MADVSVGGAVKHGYTLSHVQGGWISPLKAAISSISPEAAVYRPAPGVKNAWEVVLHTNRWCEALLEDLTGKPNEKLPDWPKVKKSTAAEWKRTKSHALEVINRLETVLNGLTDEEWAAPPGGMKTPRCYRAMDIVVHGAYHAGQLVKLRQLYRSKS